MIRLAMDTSLPIGSVVISRGATTLARATLQQAPGHAAGLVPAIAATMEAAGISRSDIEGIVVGEGPGSFTGVRVAAATAKGLSRTLRVPMWGISSLAAAALTPGEGGVRYALFDARSDRVYGACFAIGPVGVRTVVEPHAGRLDDVLHGTLPVGVEFTGDAADKHRLRIEAAGYGVVSGGVERTLADGLIRYLELESDARPVADPGAWEPSYVRASSAERLWTT